MKYLFSLFLVFALATSALAVDITIKLPVPADGDWKPVLKAAATEIQMLNAGLPALQADPIPCNPDAEQVELFLGDVNTYPNEFGYVTVVIDKWRKLIIPKGISPTTFEFVFGIPVEDVVSADGTVTQVYGGKINGR